MKTLPTDIVLVKFKPTGSKKYVNWYGRPIGEPKNGVVSFLRMKKDGTPYDEGSTLKVHNEHVFIAGENEIEITKLRMNLTYAELEKDE